MPRGGKRVASTDFAPVSALRFGRSTWTGKPTGKIELKYEGEEGLVGYLKWTGLHHPAAFLAQLGHVLPLSGSTFVG